jgi:hypothetical protein
MRNQSQNKTKTMKKSLLALLAPVPVSRPRSPFAAVLASLPLLTFVRSFCRPLSACRPQSSVIRHLKQPFTIRHSLFAAVRHRFAIRYSLFAMLTALLAVSTGCQVLTYHSPTGERFTRSSLGATTAISSLTVEAGTNGIRRVDLQGYTNNSTQALGAVTEAAVKAALQSVKP